MSGKGKMIEGVWCPQVSKGLISCPRCSVYPVKRPDGHLCCPVCGKHAPGPAHWNKACREDDRRAARERTRTAGLEYDAKGRARRRTRRLDICPAGYDPDSIGEGWRDATDAACARRLGFEQADRRHTEKGDPDIFEKNFDNRKY